MLTIEKLRKAKGWTQDELAFRAGVSQGLISSAERGTRFPRKTSLEAIANALEVEVADLISREEADELSLLELLEVITDKLASETISPQDREDLLAIAELMRRALVRIDRSTKKKTEDD